MAHGKCVNHCDLPTLHTCLGYWVGACSGVSEGVAKQANLVSPWSPNKLQVYQALALLCLQIWHGKTSSPL